MKKTGFLVIILCFLSCSQEKQTPIVSLDVLRCLNCTEDPRTDVLPYSGLRIVKLETNEFCIISDIKQVSITDSMIFILDTSKQLFVFNNNGHFISQIGKYGSGPGEYMELSTFYIDSTDIVIIDDAKGALIKYDFHGKYLDSESVPLEFIRRSGQAVLTEDGNLLLHHGMNMEENMAYSLLDTKENNLISRYFSYNPIQLNNYIYYFSTHPISKCMEEIHFIMPLCDTLYSYPSFLPEYIVETPRKMASRNQITDHTNSYSTDVVFLNRSGFFTGFTAIYETSHYIYLECKYDGVALGYFFADKTTKEGYYYFGMETDNKRIPVFHIVSSSGNSLIGVAKSEELLQLNFEFESGYTEGQQLENICSSLLEDDNPILFFYEFNDVNESSLDTPLGADKSKALALHKKRRF